MKHLRLIAVFPLLVGLGIAQPAFANPPVPPPPAAAAAAAQAGARLSMNDRARAFAVKYNLPIREVKVTTGGGQQATRIFIPVTEATHDAFVKEFSDNGVVVLQREADKEHINAMFSPTDYVGPFAGPHASYPPKRANEPGLLVALDLTDQEKAHFKATIPQGQQKGGRGGCMSWFANSCVAPDLPLAHKFGIKQSNVASNLVRKLAYAGNEGVVVGVPILPAAGSQLANLRNQLMPIDQRMDQIKAQIAQLEQQGGGRGRAFVDQMAPHHEAIAQLDQVIAARQEKQPAIAAGLKARKDEAMRGIQAATQQHEAPFHQRIAQLDASIAQKKNNVHQLEANRDIDLKATRDQLVAFEKQKTDLERLAPAANNPNRYERRLAEIDHTIQQFKDQGAHAKAQLEAQRGQAKGQIAHWHEQIRAAVAAAPHMAIGARPENAAAFNQRVAQLEQNARNLEAAIAQHQNAPGFGQQVEGWRQALAEAQQERAQLQQQGPAHFNPAYNQRVAQLDQQIKQLRDTLNANPVHPQVPQQLAQLNTLVGQRQAVMQQGPANFNPQFDARIAQLDQEIVAGRANVERLRGNPQWRPQLIGAQAALEKSESMREELGKLGPQRYTQQLDQTLNQYTQNVLGQRQQVLNLDMQEEQQDAVRNQQIAQQEAERQGVVQKGPQGYHPEFDAEMARIDAGILNANNYINQYGRLPQYAPHVNGQRQIVAQLQAQKAQLQQQNPAEFNPQYAQRIAQLDQAIAQNRAQVAQYEANPAYAAHLPGARAQLAQNETLRADLAKLGPGGYDPQYDQKLAGVVQQVVNMKAQLEAKEAQHANGIELARIQLANEEALKENLVHHGALHYNPAYEQRIAQLDQQNAQIEGQIKQYAAPQYQANRQQWQAQIDANKKIRDELMAKGPEGYNPFEPQIEQLRQQLQQQENAAAPIRQQIAVAEAAAGAQNDLAKQFAAIPEQVLLGPPPGGEAVRR